jgi:hypothetical protein
VSGKAGELESWRAGEQRQPESEKRLESNGSGKAGKRKKPKKAT